MKAAEVRTKYLEFLKKHGHVIVESDALVLSNDPTTLFTTAGMQPMMPYLLGKKHPLGDSIADFQRCFRSEDIDEVGDNRHTTFFEMLGNWSFGAHYKKEQLTLYFEFLTVELGLNPYKIYVTCFIGDEKNGIPKDTESAKIWKELFKSVGIDAKEVVIGSEQDGYEKGIGDGRIFYYDAKKNWWSRCGTPENMPAGEPGGPDSEVFYDFGTEHDPSYGKYCHVNCDCGRFVEFGNNVFMEYIKNLDGTFSFLPQKNIDQGSGFERIVAATNGSPDMFTIDIFREIMKPLLENTNIMYETAKPEQLRSIRIVSDHIRGITHMIADDVIPSNTAQGYILRRLIRRAVYFATKLGADESILLECASQVIEVHRDTYHHLFDKKNHITSVLQGEIAKFKKTLESGLRQFEKYAKSGFISGHDAFILFSTHGFPFEMTVELASAQGISVNKDEYLKAMRHHQDTSKTAGAGMFKGGLVDTSEQVLKYHTATHLLNAALQKVLGDHVVQKGSNLTHERLRFDFSHSEKMTDEQKAATEALVQSWIDAKLPVTQHTMSKDSAKELGAQGVFDDKYGDEVSIYTIGSLDNYISKEFCGGPHVENTGILGTFTIQKEEAVSAGVRRIKAVLH